MRQESVEGCAKPGVTIVVEQALHGWDIPGRHRKVFWPQSAARPAFNPHDRQRWQVKSRGRPATVASDGFLSPGAQILRLSPSPQHQLWPRQQHLGIFLHLFLPVFLHAASDFTCLRKQPLSRSCDKVVAREQRVSTPLVAPSFCSPPTLNTPIISFTVFSKVFYLDV